MQGFPATDYLLSCVLNFGREIVFFVTNPISSFLTGKEMFEKGRDFSKKPKN